LDKDRILLKSLLPLLFFASATFAQEFDLGSIPPDYAFTSRSPDSTTNMRLIKRAGDRWLFEESATYADGTVSAVRVWVNRKSQTLSWGEGGTETRYAPHDCAPEKGLCFYTWTDSEGVFEMKSETRISGNIWVSDTYFKDGDTWSFWERNCTTYDEFGFWIDFVRIFNDDSSDSGARDRAGPNQLDELWRICKPPRLSS
jgi:hypothetical protein